MVSCSFSSIKTKLLAHVIGIAVQGQRAKQFYLKLCRNQDYVNVKKKATLP